MVDQKEILPGQDILGLLETTGIPEIQWDPYDDLCDCIFQRYQWMTNPFLGRTMEVRLCCIWAELYKQYPQFIREIPASDDQNANQYRPEPREWQAEFDMPRSLWYRQLAVQHGLPLETIRKMYEDEEPPKARGQ